VPTARATSSPEVDNIAAAPGEAAQVLITRPEPGAADTAARVAALGLVPLVVPVLATRPVEAVLPSREGIAAVLLTSSSAIRALLPEYHDLPLLTVGDATAARARAAGFRYVRSAGGDAHDLACLAKTQLQPNARPILLAVGQFQGNALAGDLRSAGFRVRRRVVYSMVPARTLTAPALAALRAGQVRAALFFSAETARHFVHLVQRARVDAALRSVEAISIGQPAAMALGRLKWRRIRVAARPNQDEMLALLR
jgi:uroporphyrinogen-III synthase